MRPLNIHSLLKRNIPAAYFFFFFENEKGFFTPSHVLLYNSSILIPCLPRLGLFLTRRSTPRLFLKLRHRCSVSSSIGSAMPLFYLWQHSSFRLPVYPTVKIRKTFARLWLSQIVQETLCGLCSYTVSPLLWCPWGDWVQGPGTSFTSFS